MSPLPHKTYVAGYPNLSVAPSGGWITFDQCKMILWMYIPLETSWKGLSNDLPLDLQLHSWSKMDLWQIGWPARGISGPGGPCSFGRYLLSRPYLSKIRGVNREKRGFLMEEKSFWTTFVTVIRGQFLTHFEIFGPSLGGILILVGHKCLPGGIKSEEKMQTKSGVAHHA